MGNVGYIHPSHRGLDLNKKNPIAGGTAKAKKKKKKKRPRSPMGGAADGFGSGSQFFPEDRSQSNLGGATPMP